MGAGAGPDDGAPGLAGLKHGISELESAGWCLGKGEMNPTIVSLFENFDFEVVLLILKLYTLWIVEAWPQQSL